MSSRLLLAPFLLFLSCPLAPAAEPENRPNIVLCMADDQGYGDIGYYGNPLPHTPNLDAMSRQALRLDRFYAAAPVCSPTRASVLTGRHPNRLGCFKWGYTLRPQELTVAESLKKAGYRTGHFGKWHLGSVRASSPCCPGQNGFDKWLSSPNFYENDPWMSANGRAIQVVGESSDLAIMSAIQFIRESADSKKPFLAVVWFGSPHLPHIADPIDKVHYKDQPEAVQNYYGEITGIDRAMGTLRLALRVMGLAEDTIVWYTSDNGAQTSGNRPGSNGGLAGRKGTLWEGGIRVPTIIEWPKTITTPRTSTVTGNTFDILPTLLDLAGVTRPAGAPPLDGISLRPLVEGKSFDREKPMGFWDYPARGRPVRSSDLLKQLASEQQAGKERPSGDIHPGEGQIEPDLVPDINIGHAAWMEGPFKLHRLVNKEGVASYQLFHLENDRAEKNDLAAGMPDQVARMKKGLAAWQKSVINSYKGEDY
ncbi:MAG: sulfatase-like hydrolase/transferase [Planctomycetota bacterium]|nr:sulfatase-like hydrolase/transferase [Planctomycetota bacterium]MEE2989413.1 sulfatase-like hydrolase/transferase [Planctomycetota bacterium]